MSAQHLIGDVAVCGRCAERHEGAHAASWAHFHAEKNPGHDVELSTRWFVTALDPLALFEIADDETRERILDWLSGQPLPKGWTLTGGADV